MPAERSPPGVSSVLDFICEIGFFRRASVSGGNLEGLPFGDRSGSFSATRARRNRSLFSERLNDTLTFVHLRILREPGGPQPLASFLRLDLCKESQENARVSEIYKLGNIYI